ncbi:acyltransferase family protein [Roseateles terrae]|uniref:Surface polysaccharide O-acyltransferase-like enzyme n=1 Tax=Roseateles terrae TaxID=431060 RepID=A0ABR6GS97_9BURK|nr:acyltransferase family protein [Roseateles terrae]MBB3195003.1 surface polysaccharide O-acyltransferase-like enzyme [Roseateles terrae]
MSASIASAAAAPAAVSSGAASKRLPGIDALRIFGAVLVVGLHVGRFPEWPVPAMELTVAAGRWVVPFFFVVMGFFIGQRPQWATTALASAGRLLQITLVCAAIYGVLHVVQLGPKAGFERMLSQDAIVRGVWGHLWFMHAALAGVLLAAARPDWVQPSGAWWGIVAVILLASAVDSLCAMGRVSWPTMFATRFLGGAAMVWLGIKLASVPVRTLTRAWPMLLVGGAILLVLQGMAVRWKGGVATELQLHVGAVLMGVGAMGLGMALPATALMERLADWGRRFALGLYLLHPLLIEVLRSLGVRRSDLLWLSAAALTLLLLWTAERVFPRGKAVLDGR